MKKPGLETFKKDDFLTAAQAAKQLGLAEEIVAKTMKQMRLKKATFVLQEDNARNSPRMAVYNFNGQSHNKRNADRLHPLALDLLNQEIKKKTRGI
ncbi:MAG: hypothetical protein LBF37_02790 [Rickettsiales bacterium]|jgi:hypothetical protein|nr:hypothetical protein [Rickettsiales bacterium]